MWDWGGRVKEGRDGNIKGQMKLVPSGHSDCSFYSVTCHRGSRCLLEVSPAGLLTHSTFNITDWIVQGVTIDSDTARWKGASLHILFFAPSVSACPAFAAASSSSSSPPPPLPLLVLKITVKSPPLFSFLGVNGVSVAANHPAFPSPVNVMTRPWLTSSLHWISSHSEGTMLRGFQATWTLMTQGPLIVNGEQVSGTIGQGQGGALFNAIDYLSWPSAMKREEGNRERECFLSNWTPLSLCFSIFLYTATPPHVLSYP